MPAHSTALETARASAPALNAEAQALAAASISLNTRRAYARQLAGIDAALAGQPLTDARLAEYLASAHGDGLAPASIAQAAAAVKFRARLNGQDGPAGPATARVLAGIRREGRRRGRGQAQAVRWSQANAAAAVAENGGQDLAGLRDAAMIAVASDALLRVSELAAIQAQDISREADGTGRLAVHASKTDQDGKGASLFLGPDTARRVQAWRQAAGIESGPLFCRVRRGGIVDTKAALSAQSVRRIFKARCEAAGMDASRVSGHSFRVGSAQSLVAAGAGLAELQQAGRWQSASMPAHYARGELAGRGAVARLRYRQ